VKVIGLLLVLTGCAAHLPRPVVLRDAVDPASLIAWNAVSNSETKEILCPKCSQSKNAPRWCRDRNGLDVLIWKCHHCGAAWVSGVAINLKTIP